MPTKLLKYADLPAWRQDNPSILTGYREEKRSWFGCLRTAVEWHNESESRA
ncbi:hypothetical protein PM082_022541 [Marasmius tenuissimus]|nr:hypothetical protein PM082_022541 [Marasmius tenuissimus]